MVLAIDSQMAVRLLSLHADRTPFPSNILICFYYSFLLESKAIWKKWENSQEIDSVTYIKVAECDVRGVCVKG
jgi:hypothetical protein